MNNSVGPYILCISGKAQHGKDTIAEMFREILVSKGNRVLLTHYADLLKWMCTNYFNWDGLKDEKGRTLLQRVGTDVIRKQEPDFWVNWVVNLIKLFPHEWDYIIISDCRFPNEINALKKAFVNQTYHFRVVRPDFTSSLSEAQRNHISETALDNFGMDELILNRSLAETRAFVELICKEYFS